MKSLLTFFRITLAAFVLSAAGAAFADTRPAGDTDPTSENEQNRPESPERPEAVASIGEELQSVIRSYRLEQDALLAERRDLLTRLQEASHEERRAALAALEAAQAERIAAQLERAKTIREAIGQTEVPTDRPESPRERDLPGQIQNLLDHFRAERAAMIAEQRALLESLKDASAEERRARLAELREEHRERLEAQRELQREVRERVRDIRDERRRPRG